MICTAIGQTSPDALPPLTLSQLDQKLGEFRGKLNPKVIEGWAKACKVGLEHKNKLRMNAAKFKPIYDDKVERIKLAIEELSVLPNTKTQLDLLKGLVTAGAKSLVGFPGDYEKAYKALEGLSGALEAGRKAAKEFEKLGGASELKTEIEKVKKEIISFNAIGGISQYAVVEKAEADLHLVMMNLSSATDIKAAIGQAKKPLWVRFQPTWMMKPRKLCTSAAPVTSS